jgi:hypothetical protein
MAGAIAGMPALGGGSPPAAGTTAGGAMAAAPPRVGAAAGDAAVPPSMPAIPGGVTTIPEAGAPDSGIAYSVMLTMDSFTVDPGGEVWKCQDFANPFGGQPADIKLYHNVMGPGSHHFTLFSKDGATNGSLIDCPEGGLMAGPYTFGAQAQDVTYPLPPGIGVAIPGSTGFTMNAHYLNPGASSVQGHVVLTMSVATPGSVTQHAGVMQFVYLSIAVPPGGPITVGSSCSLPQDMNVMIVVSHMHHQASHFIASTGGMTLLETDQWSDPPGSAFWPALSLKSGADFTWSCIYNNDTLTTLTYGPSAQTDVMCNAVLTYYPVQDINNPFITCAM